MTQELREPGKGFDGKEFVYVRYGNTQHYHDELKAMQAAVGVFERQQMLLNHQMTVDCQAISMNDTAYGTFTIRYRSGLDGRAILARGMTREEAIQFGKSWVDQNPDHREFHYIKEV